MSEIKGIMELLLSPTPIAHRLLMAAWDNLSFESQCDLLLNYGSVQGQRLRNHWVEIGEVAIKSPYPLVRYLGSKIIGSEKKYEAQVRNDPHPLVSASNMISGCDYFSSVFKNITSFLSLNQAERIEQLSNCSNSGGKFFDLMLSVKKEMEKGLLKQAEVFEMLFAYLTNPYVKREIERDFSKYGPEGGFNWFSDGEERNSLWKLITLFPDQWNLPEFLPAVPQGAIIKDLKSIADELTKGKFWQTLDAIFQRKDIKEDGLKKTLFDELMRAVVNSDPNSRFTDIGKYDAISLISSLSSKNESWEEINKKICCYFDGEGA